MGIEWHIYYFYTQNTPHTHTLLIVHRLSSSSPAEGSKHVISVIYGRKAVQNDIISVAANCKENAQRRYSHRVTDIRGELRHMLHWCWQDWTRPTIGAGQSVASAGDT